jgi:hypothetical protein
VYYEKEALADSGKSRGKRKKLHGLRAPKTIEWRDKRARKLFISQQLSDTQKFFPIWLLWCQPN